MVIILLVKIFGICFNSLNGAIDITIAVANPETGESFNSLNGAIDII